MKNKRKEFGYIRRGLFNEEWIKVELLGRKNYFENDNWHYPAKSYFLIKLPNGKIKELNSTQVYPI